jgi:hypothetical protein
MDGTVARARCSALFADATVVPSSSAVSAADSCSTSRRISAPRWRGVSRCSAATKASLTVSLSTSCSAGSPLPSVSLASGIGSTQVRSLSGVGTWTPSARVGGCNSIGKARRLRLRSMSMHTFVAIRCSQVRSDERPSKPPYSRHARTIVSCTASSASNGEPSIR